MFSNYFMQASAVITGKGSQSNNQNKFEFSILNATNGELNLSDGSQVSTQLKTSNNAKINLFFQNFT